MRIARLALLLLLVTVVVPLAVSAAIPRPAPISPSNGATLPVGKTPTFKIRSSGSGTVWVHVSKSSRRDRTGVIGTDAAIGQAHKKNGVYVFKPKFFNYPTFWANVRRKYYWQPFRINCADDSDCNVEGPVRSFRLH